jgi:hypothetical protein
MQHLKGKLYHYAKPALKASSYIHILALLADCQ